MFGFAKEMYSDVKAFGNESARDKTYVKMLKSPAIMASGIPHKIFSRKS